MSVDERFRAVPVVQVVAEASFWLGQQWPIPMRIVDGLLGELGWTMDDPEWYVTGHELNDPDALVSAAGSVLNMVMYKTTDIVKAPTPEDSAAILAYTEDLAAAMTQRHGEPKFVCDGAVSNWRWFTAEMAAVEISCGPKNGGLTVMSPGMTLDL